ncbi:hypothetical protein ACSU1N_04490 [Thermogladius sp. 4427co]|uniref:hypothetical protein n=1 Tax=Thermogladius sp. 4427co TaxID=3450718 RepID=UPI003F7B1E3C
MVRIYSLTVKDADRFIDTLKNAGFSIEEGPHAVLLDQSELLSIKILKENSIRGYIVLHYITPYYKAELTSARTDKEYLESLIQIKHSGEKWRIPVEDITIIVLDDGELEEIIQKYVDDYPVPEGGSLVEEYRRRNPDYKVVSRVLVGRLLDEIP